uniref:(northern house mosquito) hypothetical protein n=1 Tax=Culex pipiens TaxID=7175 RepID=A0A8D8DXX7_CULPI
MDCSILSNLVDQCCRSSRRVGAPTSSPRAGGTPSRSSLQRSRLLWVSVLQHRSVRELRTSDGYPSTSDDNPTQVSLTQFRVVVPHMYETSLQQAEVQGCTDKHVNAVWNVELGIGQLNTLWNWPIVGIDL